MGMRSRGRRPPAKRCDRYAAHAAAALNETEKKGLALFMDKGCSSCHNGVNIGGNGSMYVTHRLAEMAAELGAWYRHEAEVPPVLGLSPEDDARSRCRAWLLEMQAQDRAHRVGDVRGPKLRRRDRVDEG